MITDKDVEKLKETFVTKEDAKNFATKEDLKVFATKEDLKRFATKEDLKRFATKEDLKEFTTKKEMKTFKEDIIRHFDVVAEGIKNSIIVIAEQVSANTEKLADHDQKLETLTADVSFLKGRIMPAKAKIKK